MELQCGTMEEVIASIKSMSVDKTHLFITQKLSDELWLLMTAKKGMMGIVRGPQGGRQSELRNNARDTIEMILTDSAQ